MSDTPVIRPALTPEQWAVVLFEREENKGHPRADGYTDEDDHATAARLLYGQPFGFTQEDVVALRALTLWVGHDPAIAPLASLAARIAALLPPP